jgi:pimeloyl-ACP methyl ester carboxylesterase
MNDETPLLTASAATSGSSLDRSTFWRQTIWLVLLLTLATALTTFSTDRLWHGHGPLVVPIVLVLLGACLGIYLLMTLHGAYIWRRGELPIPASAVDRDRAKFVTSADGTRQIEYFCWGSERPDATVTVVCHGSGTTGKDFNEFLYPNQVMKQLNVKVISPSYPGHGGSDQHPHRRLADWPKWDLEPILKAESVDQFIVQGSSYGTAHAMAVLAYFPPQRCIALGLNVPYLPEPICREFGFHTDADLVFDEAKLSRPWYILPLLSLLSLFQAVVSKGISWIPEGRQAIQKNPDLVQAMQRDCARSFLRGVNGQAFEMLNATTNQHWPDPRTFIETPMIVAVWYAEDDTACPPAHGKWLAGVFQEKPGVRTNVRCEKVGLGHFTYMGAKDRENGIMTKTLLEMLQNTK